jgi:hypothetical protein
MNNLISPKYQMRLVKDVEKALWEQFSSSKNVYYYIKKWQITYDDWGNTNFNFCTTDENVIDFSATIHEIDGEILLKIAIDLGVDTPDFIPSIPTFKNELKSDYATAYDTFMKAFRQIETDPSLAIGLANSALESIIKEILKDGRISGNIKNKKTLYSLSLEILKVFRLSQNTDIPEEIKLIGSSLLTISQNIEALRSDKTDFHGKTTDDYIINDSIYAYLVVNSVTTVGLFLNSYYKKKFPKERPHNDIDDIDVLPF